MASMREIQITSFDELLAELNKFRGTNEDWLFRGQANSDWKLIPKAGRAPFNCVNDLDLFENWKKSAIALVSPIPTSDWDWLTLAQHYGLATRFLDWTINPLAAAFFAVADIPDKDGALFAILANHDTQYLYYPPDRIQDVRQIMVVLPRRVSSRVDRQMGRFTIHPKRNTELTESFGDVRKIIISAEAKLKIQEDLNFFGINKQTLFPDLEGLSAYLNWFYPKYQIDDSTPIKTLPTETLNTIVDELQSPSSTSLADKPTSTVTRNKRSKKLT